MFNKNKHRKTRKQLEQENAELRQLVAKLEGQMKQQIDMLLASNQELRAYKQKIDNRNNFRKENLPQLNYRLRTPMNEIVGMTNLLEETPLTINQLKYLKFIRNAGNNLLLILNDLLFYMRSEYGYINADIREINTRQLLEELFAELKANHQEAEFYLKANIGLPELIIGEADKLRIILFNILKLTLMISTDKIVIVNIFINETGLNRIKLRININTSFKFLADEIKDNIFMPFALADSSSKDNEASTGMELAIARSLVKNAGGEISFEYDTVRSNGFSVSLNFKNAKTIVSHAMKLSY